MSSHAPPFQNGAGGVDPLVFTALGALIVIVIMSLAYIWWLHNRRETILPEEELEKEDETQEDVRIDRMGLSKRSEDVLGVVMDAPMLQNELPDELGVSKATVSNAVSELFDRDLVMKKKKANTYLIEPNMDEIREQSR